MQWWTTGFVPEDMNIDTKDLKQICSVRFNAKDMYQAFKKKYSSKQYSKYTDSWVFDDTMNEVWIVC